MNRIAILSLVILTPVSSGCSINLIDSVQGSGVSKSEIRDIGQFDKVSLAGSGTVVIQCGQETALEVIGDDNLLELIETVVEDGTLKIRFTESVRPKIGPEFEIAMTALKGASIVGSGEVTIEQVVADKLDLNIAGSGEYLVDGNVDEVKLEISGSGEADLRKLEAMNAKVSIAGSGAATVNAKENLSVKIAGSGDIRYLKNPKIQKSIAGSGSVTAIEELPENLDGDSEPQDSGIDSETGSEDEEESD